MINKEELRKTLSTLGVQDHYYSLNGSPEEYARVLEGMPDGTRQVYYFERGRRFQNFGDSYLFDCAPSPPPWSCPDGSPCKSSRPRITTSNRPCSRLPVAMNTGMTVPCSSNKENNNRLPDADVAMAGVVDEEEDIQPIALQFARKVAEL